MFSRDSLAAEQYLENERETYVEGLPFTAEREPGSVDKGGTLARRDSPTLAEHVMRDHDDEVVEEETLAYAQ